MNPPVQAWAALEVFAIDGARDLDFLEPGLRQAARQLHLVGQPRGRRRHRTCSRAASSASTTSARSTARTCPPAYTLEQSDGTGWMALLRARHGGDRDDPAPARTRPTTDLVVKFLEHFALISEALGRQGLWDEEDGFFYDRLRRARRLDAVR